MRSVLQQSDIIIAPDGSVRVSFLWDDLRTLAGRGAPPARPDAPPRPSGPGPGPGPGAPGALGTRRPRAPRAPYAACRLCPRACGFDRTRAAHSLCGDHRLRVAAAGLTFGDEPCITGAGGSGAVMLAGCPLRCPSCHNPEMRDVGVPLAIGAFVDLAWRLRDHGAENLQVLSPTVHRPALCVALRTLRKDGFDRPIVWKSSGYETTEAIDGVAGLVDVHLPDLKYGPESSWARRAGAPDYFAVATAAIARMAAQVGSAVHDSDGRLRRGVLVRHVVAPLGAAERAAIDAFLTSLPPDVLVSRLDTFDDLEGGRPPRERGPERLSQ